MKLTTLNALVAAIEEGSLRGAARRVGVSQPALTKMLRELEVELATTLLERTSRGVLLTAQGKVLYEHAVNVSKALGAAVDAIHQLGGRMVGELAVGAVPLAVMLLMPETLRTFGREFPSVRLRVTEELYIAQLQRLRKGEVDIAVGSVPDDLSTGEFAVEPLMKTRMVVVVRRAHPLSRATSLHALSEAKWVYTGATAESGYARTLFEQHGLKAPSSGATVNSTLALISLVSTGDFVGLMPQQIAEHALAKQFLSIVPVAEGGLDLQVAAIVRRESTVLPVVRHFIAHLHRAAYHHTKDA
jgi:LysR family transcriptional regulator, regulator of abg operon